jgi:hypothetical protein
LRPVFDENSLESILVYRNGSVFVRGTPQKMETVGGPDMHTSLDQYRANKASSANAGLKWIENGGGYYSECNKRLKGAA